MKPYKNKASYYDNLNVNGSNIIRQPRMSATTSKVEQWLSSQHSAENMQNYFEKIETGVFHRKKPTDCTDKEQPRFLRKEPVNFISPL